MTFISRKHTSLPLVLSPGGLSAFWRIWMVMQVLAGFTIRRTNAPGIQAGKSFSLNNFLCFFPAVYGGNSSNGHKAAGFLQEKLRLYAFSFQWPYVRGTPREPG
jgi:hypothetical protein